MGRGDTNALFLRFCQCLLGKWMHNEAHQYFIVQSQMMRTQPKERAASTSSMIAESIQIGMISSQQ